MNLHDIFKSFFGIPKPGNHGEFDFYRNDDEEDNDNNDPEDGDDFLDARIPHPSDMFRHFEEMFRTFGLQDFPPPQFGTTVPGLETLPGERNDSLRNKMLKDPEFSPTLKQPQYRAPMQDRTDRDLDELSPDELGKVLVSPNILEPSRKPSNYRSSFFKSISVSTVRGPDGKIEQKKITRDSSGNEETTITHSQGDQTYSLTTKRDSTGCEEKREDLINLDEGKVDEFEKKWSRRRTSETIKDVILSDMQPIDQNMFRKFFGSWFSR